jgi:hypothetical protein
MKVTIAVPAIPRAIPTILALFIGSCRNRAAKIKMNILLV